MVQGSANPNNGAKPKLPTLRNSKRMNSSKCQLPLESPYVGEHSVSTPVQDGDTVWFKSQLYAGITTDNTSDVDATVITTASLVIGNYPENNSDTNCGPQSCTESQYRRSESADGALSDYDNNGSITSPPQGLLSKSSSTSSSSSFYMRTFNRSAHSLSSTSLSSVSFPLFQPIEYAPNHSYSFHTSDCEDHSDYVPHNFTRSLQRQQTTPSPLISRPSSPLPPTPSPSFSRSPSPNRINRKPKYNFKSSGTFASCSMPGSPQFSRSLNGSRETSPLRLRPSSYTRPLSPNPPTISPGVAAAQQYQSTHATQNQSSRPLRSQPSSPISHQRSPMFHQTVQSNQYHSPVRGASCSSATGSRTNLNLRSPPSPTRPATPVTASSQRSALLTGSPVTSRPPSPLNTSRQHVLLHPNVRPARSQSQPPGSQRLHSRQRSTRTPSPRPPRLPCSPHSSPPPPPPPPTTPQPDSSKRSSRMRAR